MWDGAFIHFLRQNETVTKTSFTSSEWETTSFCSHFSTNPRRPESETQPKRHNQDQKTFSRKFLWNLRFFGLSSEVITVTFLSHSAIFCFDECYCHFNQSGVAIVGATNVSKMRQREAVTVSLFFPPLHSEAIFPTTSTNRHFVLSSVSLTLRDQDGSPSNSMINVYNLTEK